jgi:hypothetical protein
VPNTDSPVFAGIDIIDTSGQVQASWVPAEPIFSFQALWDDRIYVPDANRVGNLATGAVLWDGSTLGGGGAVAGSSVTFVSGTQVIAEPL